MNSNFVLITGASSGLGLEFAKLSAQKKYNLVLVSRRKSELDKIAEILRGQYDINIHTISSDLSIPSSTEEIFSEVNDKLKLEIDILINNAGFGTNGEFSESDLNKEIEMIKVNVLSLVSLTRLFITSMKKRRKGIILNVASTASYQPGPYMSVYYASKAFVKNFTRALQEELKPFNVNVSLFSPGPTRTDFQKRANVDDTLIGIDFVMMTAEKAAKIGFKGALKGKKEIIPGFFNKIGVFAAKVLPETLVVKAVGLINNKRIRK